MQRLGKVDIKEEEVHTCFGTSRLLCVFISAPVGVLERVNVVRIRCIVLRGNHRPLLASSFLGGYTLPPSFPSRSSMLIKKFFVLPASIKKKENEWQNVIKIIMINLTNFPNVFFCDFRFCDGAEKSNISNMPNK